jgi:putative selenium metabolism hydrolase
MAMVPSFDGALAFARELIRIPGLPGEEGAVAERVVRELETLQFDEVWRDEVGNCFGLVRGTASAPAVMLNCHLDAVDVGDRAGWERDPFSGEIADGFLHGRGAMDIKGPLALQTHAAATFLRNRLPGDILVAHTVHEERGGWGMEFLLQQGRVKPGAVILGEATCGDVCIGHRGRAEVVIELQGQAGHASAPERARNPIEFLPAVLPVLDRFARSLPSDAVLGPSTIAPTAIETLPRSRNVIPDRVRVILDWRVLPGITPDAAVAAVKSVVANLPVPPGCAIDVRLSTEVQRAYTGLTRERKMLTPAFLIASDHLIVQAAAAAVERSTGRKPVLRPWAFATDGGHAAGVHGIPCIGYAPGEERYAHTNRERLELRQAQVVFDSYPEVIRSVSAALG